MSLNVFENTNLNFEVSLIKLDRSQDGDVITDVVEVIIPIDSSAVLKLEINESSLSMGAKGSITISNKFNILDRLDIITNSTNDLYLAINITDTDLDSIDISNADKVITIIGLINSTVAGSKDIVDNMIIFNWEEAFVAATRMTHLTYFSSQPDIIDVKDQDVKTLAEAFNDNIYKLKGDSWITARGSGNKGPNVKHDLKVTPGDDVSVYDAIQSMLKESTMGVPNTATVGKVSYFRFVNTLMQDKTVKRKLKYDAFLSDRHIEFVSAVKVGSNTGDFNDVYLEKFAIGPLIDTDATDPNINLYNKIETYNITRADVGRLREKVWGNYRFVYDDPSPDPGPLNTNIKTFAEIEADYIDREFEGNNFGVNLPLLDPKEIKEFLVEVNTLSDPPEATNARLQQENKVANIVIKSFLTINETISFTVKGSIIRQPNKFIWIERDHCDEDYMKLWYVNSVTHRFEDGKYTTDVIATKLFGSTFAGGVGAAVGDANRAKPGGGDGIEVPEELKGEFPDPDGGVLPDSEPVPTVPKIVPTPENDPYPVNPQDNFPVANINTDMILPDAASANTPITKSSTITPPTELPPTPDDSSAESANVPFDPLVFDDEYVNGVRVGGSAFDPTTGTPIPRYDPSGPTTPLDLEGVETSEEWLRLQLGLSPRRNPQSLIDP